MSLLSKNSPKATRTSDEKPKSERPQRQEIIPDIEVLSSSPENKTTEYKKLEDKKPNDISNDLINRYKYNGTATEDKKTNEFAPSEHETIAPQEQTLNLFDMSYMCEYFCISKLTQPIPIQSLKIYDLEISYLQDKIKLYTSDYKEIAVGVFKDRLYIYRSSFIIPDELYKVSGFLRYYFGIEEVFVILLNGLIETRETLYCNYWNEHLDSIKEKDILTMQVQSDQKYCQKCILNKITEPK